MPKTAGFGRKNCSSLPSLVWKRFDSLRNGDEVFYTNADSCIDCLVRQTIKRCMSIPLHQNCQCEKADEGFIFF